MTSLSHVNMAPASSAEHSASESELRIPLRDAFLSGTLDVPIGASGLVIFAHGSGSSRLSPRNVFVARAIQGAGIATLLFDLLTAAEEVIDIRTRQDRFDIPLLAKRLVIATSWTRDLRGTRGLPVGYFGASTGSAAALIAAATLREQVQAVVSRGGRPDLAWDALREVMAPTLLIVGGFDSEVIGLNRKAYDELRCRKSLEIVPGASHLFEEPGALERAAALAREWFAKHLQAVAVTDQ